MHKKREGAGLFVGMDRLMLNKRIECNEEARVLGRLKMCFSVVLKEEAIVRNTIPTGI